MLGMSAFGQDKRTVSGTVRDSVGDPLPGVSIVIKGTQNGTLTDKDGHYQLQLSPKDVLVFSYLGFNKKEVSAGNVDLLSRITLSKSSTSGELGEVVVTSLGIKKQARALGYSVSTVSAKDITEAGATNFASAMYGKAAGVRINTAPGGATSAVSMQIRGVSSISENTQPLYVVDGVPIRLYNDLQGNASAASNNQGYWSNTRINSNGVLDINPEDIESVSVLKGAAAAALYGSEATNGVVVITTKKGKKGQGMGVELNYVLDQEKLAQSPDFQNEYGPGYDEQTNVAYVGATPDGWLDSSNSATIHPFWGAEYNFGPKFDGRKVQYWDGTTRNYVAYPNNYKDFFQTGYNSSANVAVSNATDKGNFRLSYTRTDYKAIIPGATMYKNNFNFNGTLNLSNAVSIDLVSTYNNNFTHNRPALMGQIFASSGGWFTRGDDMATYYAKYKTTDNYKYVLPTNNSYDQDQQLTYQPSATNIMDYLWTALYDKHDETQNRFINSLTLNISLLNNLKVRGRIGNDVTFMNINEEDHNTEPASVGNSGSYDLTNNTFNILYGDVLATYMPKITNDLHLSVSAGYTARKETYNYQYSATSGGLQTENFFVLQNSVNPYTTSSNSAEQIDVAGFGVVDLDWKHLLYLEGTGRYESSSTLPPGANDYFYPGVSAGFILSDAVKLPKVINYAKIRAAYAEVGNHPNIYEANVDYNQWALTYNGTNVIYAHPNTSSFGNLGVKPEIKNEAEFGIETRLFNDKLGVDLTYYNNYVNNQILQVSTSSSVGATGALMNAGNLDNYGYEAAFTVNPINTRHFHWTSRLNFAINKNKLASLSDGLTNLVSSSQDGGYLILRADVGSALGNIYVHPTLTDSKGNAILDQNGLYQNNPNAYQYAGNIMPKVIGGWSNSFNYKSFTLDFTLDYRFGGKLISIPTYYMMGAGMYKSTLQYRDAAHGGLAYAVGTGGDANLDYTLNQNGTRHDGLVLKGVDAAGDANTKVITAGMYYENTYDWETNGLYQNAVFNNSYIKLREATLTYNLPKKVVSTLRLQGLQFSFIGRNLFYVLNTLPHHLDPEDVVGSSWYSQGIDGGTGAPTRSLGVSLRARF
jgi:iron complex outermembrane recepter protein